ncbi:root hair specific 2 [Forsythia ovata]|uniref:Root hair specific 2 n=1 Tax=Forsythia ovata TaxID=205694 RepID=A0ABD1TC62_9LAMI
MGSALETLCGQAFGAGQMDMLGVYMQRSWIILLTTAFFLMFFYIFAAPLLRLIGQTPDISRVAGEFAIWMIPQLFAYAINFPTAKFLQSQSKMMVMSWIAGIGLILHTFFSWLFMLRLRWGIVGAAVVLNLSWWLIVVAQLVYIFMGSCGRAWSGFSWKAFQNLWSFVRLSLASAVMLCLEMWYFMSLILFAGYLKNAEVAVDVLSICANLVGWAVMVAIGWNAAISVRVSNELGAAHPRTAKFSVLVVVASSFTTGLLLALLLIIFRKQYPSLFADNIEVQKYVYDLTPLLVFCIVVNNIQPALSGTQYDLIVYTKHAVIVYYNLINIFGAGVAIGAGWQAIVAYVNIACYYLFGIPLGLIMGFKLNWGVQGIWYGMTAGTILQTIILLWLVYRTNWNKEASVATQRIKKWGGDTHDKSKDVEQ